MVVMIDDDGRQRDIGIQSFEERGGFWRQTATSSPSLSARA
jgi:hypothetical protein